MVKKHLWTSDDVNSLFLKIMILIINCVSNMNLLSEYICVFIRKFFTHKETAVKIASYQSSCIFYWKLHASLMQTGIFS